MRIMFSLVLMVGLTLAGGAVYMAKSYIGGYQQALAKERAARQQVIKTVPVYVADTALGYGDVLTSDTIRQVDWPQKALPEGTFATLEDILPNGDSEPRVVLRQIEAFEAILAVKVTEPGETAGITSRLARGMRAFALKVDVASGVSGFLRAGDRVDIYWTGKVASPGQGTGAVRSDVTKLIEAGVSLVAVDQSASGERDGTLIARTVTVSATPQQVAGLALAQSTGRLSLSLVGAGDDSIPGAVEIDQARLLGLTAQAKPLLIEAKEEKVCTIRTRRGSEVMDIPIPCTN